MKRVAYFCQMKWRVAKTGAARVLSLSLLPRVVHLQIGAKRASQAVIVIGSINKCSVSLQPLPIPPSQPSS